MATNNLNIPFVVQSQAQKEVTINQAFSALEALQNRGVEDKDLSSPPVSPAEGDAYIVGAAPSGAWAGKAKNVAYYNNGWRFIEPNEGLHIWVSDEDLLYGFDGTDWLPISTSTSLPQLGINATADSTNKLSVNSDAILFNHNGTDIRAKLSKSSAGDTASFLFQDNFSGRAEFGLVGDDDFTLKVSNDGSIWSNAFKVNKTNGCIDFLNGVKFAGGTTMDTYAEGTWTPVLRGSSTAGSNTYTAQAGRYFKIGKFVYVSGRVAISGAVGGTMAGTMQISGLPFTSYNAEEVYSGISIATLSNVSLTASTQLAGQVINNSTVINLIERGASGDTAITSTAKFGSNFEIRFSACYEANS